MSELVRRVNRFFSTASRSEIDELYDQLVLSDRQGKVFQMFYVRKLNIGYIADTLGFCSNVIDRDLQAIRKKMDTLIP